MIDDFDKKIQEYFPGWKYEILEYTKTREPMTIKCNFCGMKYNYNNARDIFRKINPCKCFKIFSNGKEKIEYYSKKYDFTILEINAERATIQCNKCGKISTRTLVALKQHPNACSCKSYPPKSKEQLQGEIDLLYPKEYCIMESKGEMGKCVIKHLNCGFIFKATCFHDLIVKRNRGCPKCYQFKSLGERKIREFLEDNHINYIPQKTFSPLNKSKYRFDFFLPDLNLAIEYQGEQHYRDNGYFKDSLAQIQKRDEIKRKYCKENNIDLLEICYKDYQKINQILSSKLNDYGVSQ